VLAHATGAFGAGDELAAGAAQRRARAFEVGLVERLAL